MRGLSDREVLAGSWVAGVRGRAAQTWRTTGARAAVEPLEPRVVMSATIEAAPVSASAEAGVFALGGNLQFQSEGTRDHAMADLVKSSSGFRDLGGGTASVDAAGWPTEDFSVPLWNRDVVPGEYRISFTGPADTVVTSRDGDAGTPTNLTPGAAGTQSWVIDVPDGADELTLKFTGTSGQVTDLKVVQPGNAAGQVWSTRYLNFLKTLDPDTIRVMDMVRTNFDKTSNWADRPLPSDATFNAGGVPWEHVIALANEVGANLWIPVPVRASDDYVRQLAALVKSNLNPGLTAYVEYANETWSTLHEPGKYNLAQAKAEASSNPNSDLRYDGTTNSNTWQYRRNARRLKEIVDLFREVWTTNSGGTVAQADPVNGRVKGILGGRASEDQRFDVMLKYVSDNFGAPSNWFYGIAGAWYFSLNKYRDELVDGRRLSVDQVLEGMGISVGLYESEQRFAKTAARAATWNLKLAAYELGVDTMGDANVGPKAAAHRDPRIGPLMERFVRAFHDQAGVVANWYTIGARTFQADSGAWTVTEELEDVDSPKAAAFRSIRGNPLPPPPGGGNPPPPPPPSNGAEVTVSLVQGAARSALTDGQAAVVDFGAVAAGSSESQVRTFEVRNSGTAELALGLAGAPSGFEIIDGLAESLAPGGVDVFTLRMSAGGAAGGRAGVVNIVSNDADESPFNFTIRGEVTGTTAPPPPPPATGPELTLLVNGTSVGSGIALDLGTKEPGGLEPTLTLTVRNDGDTGLDLGTVTVPAGYELAGAPASAVLQPGAEAAMTLRLTATVGGTYAGAVVVPSSDADESPFTLNLTAVVVGPPAAPPPPQPPAPGGLVVASVSASRVPAVLIAGGRASQGALSVTLRSDAGAFNGPATVAVHASGDGTLDASDTQLAVTGRTLRLGPGQAAKPVSLKVPLAALPAGPQTLLVTVTAAGTAATAAGPSVSVEAARVNVVGPPDETVVPKPLGLGKRATLAVPLANTGNVATTRSPATYTLLFTTDGTEGTSVFSTAAAGRLSLKANGGMKPQKIALTLPPSGGALAPGSYVVLVRLDAELNGMNGQTVARMRVTVV